MAKELINLDREALAGAAKLYGTATDEDTINAALRDAAARNRRREGFARLAEMAEAGELDYLLDKRNYRR
ncbi:DUF2191 domain-containing protein [Actinoplanes sp. NPDC051513]|uniref:DUF2191 domain-containing protein n=1 Tax=Actinoplanes sp. NPDC051513 TaxID=3363908 RepID=UPI00379AC7A3